MLNLLSMLRQAGPLLAVASIAFVAGGSFSSSWSIEFEETCYVFDVDGSKYQRTVRPTYNAPPGYGYVASLIFALSAYQLDFGLTGTSGYVPGITDPCPGSSVPAPALTRRQVEILERRLAGDYLAR